MDTVLLGVASFLYVLKTFKKSYYMPNKRCLIVNVPKLSPILFSLSDTENNKKNMVCGYILSDKSKLKNIFGEGKLDDILNLCERKNTDTFRHCAVYDNPELKNNIPTCTDGFEFDCLHP